MSSDESQAAEVTSVQGSVNDGVDDSRRLGRRTLLKGAGTAAVSSLGMTFPTSTGVAAGSIDGPTGVHISYGVQPQGSVRIGWTGGAATEVRVEYGRDNLDDSVTANSTVVPGEGLIAYQAEITGLQPGTTYRYRAVLDGQRSETLSFTTAPTTETTSFRVTAVGDNGIADSRNPAQRADDDSPVRVVKRAESLDPDLHLGVGDIAYANGYPFTWDKYFETHQSFFGTTPFLTVPGNHEKEPGQGFKQYDARLNSIMPFDDPGLPSLNSKQRWYSVQYGNTQFIGLNTSADACGDYARGEEFFPLYDTRCRTDESYTYNKRQRQFVEEALKQAESDPTVTWKVVYFHSSFWTDGDHDAREDLRTLWEPFFDEYDVDLVLAGHNHSYERSKPMRGDAVRDTGTTYVVNGTGGSGHYGFQHNEPPAWTAFRDNDHYGITQLDISADSIEGKYVAMDGSTIDSFTIVKRNGKPTQRHPGDASAERLAVSGSRHDDRSTHTAGQTNRVRLTATAESDRSIRVRDVLPTEWTVQDRGNSSPSMVSTENAPTGKKYVYFEGGPENDRGVVYYVEAPDETGTYAFGPFEAREIDGSGWVAVDGTSSDETVVNGST